MKSMQQRQRTGARANKEAYVKKIAFGAVVALSLTLGAAHAQQPAADADLANFRNAYTAGDGLAYVVVPDEKGERIYRYGDASRQAAKKDPRGYMLFTCNSPHVFVVQDPKAKADLMKAKVVKAGEPGFADLDSKYVSTCKNPLVKSAVPAAPAAPSATQPAAGDPELANFRTAYTAGDGLAYVVIPDEKGDRIYRYGDAARQAAKKDPRGYMLFTCNSPHVFVVQDAKAKADLLKAKVVKAGEPTFADLDAKYIGNCKNPLVKSAIPAEKAPAKK